MPDGAVIIHGLACDLPDECFVCEEEFEYGGWASALHGDAECRNCGAPTQIRPLSEGSWDDVPRSNLADDFIEPLAEFVEETGKKVTSSDLDEWLLDNHPNLLENDE